MFRRKRMPADSARPSAQGFAPATGPARLVLSANALQDVYARVLHSFLVDGTPSPAGPHPSAPGGTASPPPSSPSGAGPTAPPPVNAPGAAFVGPLVGAEGAMGSISTGTSNLTVNIPGGGAVNRQQMEAAEAKAQAVIQEALGSTELSHLTPEDVEAVQTRLEAMRAGGRISDGQYAALSEGLALLSESAPR
jgi:hypothetical protein